MFQVDDLLVLKRSLAAPASTAVQTLTHRRLLWIALCFSQISPLQILWRGESHLHRSRPDLTTTASLWLSQYEAA
jgi:hypothetical protein